MRVILVRGVILHAQVSPVLRWRTGPSGVHLQAGLGADTRIAL